MTKTRPRLKAKTTAVLYAIERFRQGLTSADIGKRVGISTHSAAARATWLRRTGLTAYSTVERVWTLTDDARRDLFGGGKHVSRTR